MHSVPRWTVTVLAPVVLASGLAAAPASAARVDAHAQARADVSLPNARAALQDRAQELQAQLQRIETARPTRRLSAEIRGEVRAHLQQDQADLGTLATAATSADTRAEVKGIAQRLADYHPGLYRQVVVRLHAADRLATRSAQVSGSADADLPDGLASASRALDGAVEVALELDAASSAAQLRQARVQLAVAAGLFAQTAS